MCDDSSHLFALRGGDYHKPRPPSSGFRGISSLHVVPLRYSTFRLTAGLALWRPLVKAVSDSASATLTTKL